MSNYRFYYPRLLEMWDAEQYQHIVGFFAGENRSYIVTFCADLYYHNGGDTAKNAAKNLTQFAAECAKFENCTVDPQELKDWVNNLQERWLWAVKPSVPGIETVGTPNDDEIKRITLILNECPLCKLVTFVSNILFRSEIAGGLFYLGYLAGSLSKGTL